jgi:ATP-dependent Clp protease ATP-binding subunit ClpC
VLDETKTMPEQRLCDICHKRPVAAKVTISSDGERRVLNVCEVDLEKLKRQERRNFSPIESMFGDFFGNEGFEGRQYGRN